MRAFRRRTYGGPAGLLQDMRFLIENRALIGRAMRSGEISPAFRERLMMVVTEVNGCRYCSAYHSALSVRAGVSTDELRTLLGGEIPQDSPAEELPALAYAQHWAQNDARPEPDAHRGLVETYGEEKAAMIDLILRMIRAGNLAGNSWDWFLDRISFGRLGQTSRDRRASDFTPAG